MKSIESLPDGAEYSRKEGRTRVSVKKVGDKLIASARTDSVLRSVTRVEHLARDTLSQVSQRRTEDTSEKGSPAAKLPGTVALIILISGLGLALVIYKTCR